MRPSAVLSLPVRLQLGLVAVVVLGAVVLLAALAVLSSPRLTGTLCHYTTKGPSPAVTADGTVRARAQLVSSAADVLVSRAQALYPGLLTLDPAVDCARGQYLVVDILWSDGLGSMIGTFNQLTLLAAALNVTLVRAQQWCATHEEEEGATTFRAKEYLHQSRLSALAPFMNRWHASREQWEDCPMKSSVKAHLLELQLIDWAYAETTRAANSSQPTEWTSPQYKQISSFVRAMRMLPIDHRGFTVRVAQFNALAGDMYTTALIHAARAHLLQRMQDTSTALPTVAPTAPSEPKLRVGIHIRLGDLGQYDAAKNDFTVTTAWTGRFLSSAILQSVLRIFVRALPPELATAVHYTVVTQQPAGVGEDWIRQRWLAPIANASLSIQTSQSAMDSLLALANQHVTIQAMSDFSRTTCLTNVDQLKIVMKGSFEYHDRYWGCHNAWQYDTDWQRLTDDERRVFETAPVVPLTLLDRRQSVHEPSTDDLQNLTARIVEVAARPLRSISPAFYARDWSIVHEARWRARDNG